MDAPTGGAALSDQLGRGRGPLRGASPGNWNQSQDRDPVAHAFCPARPESLWQIAPGADASPLMGREDQSPGGGDPADQACGPDPLELPPDGQGPRVSKSTVSNIWRSHQVKPHRVKRFKLSRDPKFLEKLTEVVAFI